MSDHVQTVYATIQGAGMQQATYAIVIFDGEMAARRSENVVWFVKGDGFGQVDRFAVVNPSQ